MDELIPTAREYGKGHASVYALVAGMAVMAVMPVMAVMAVMALSLLVA